MEDATERTMSLKLKLSVLASAQSVKCSKVRVAKPCESSAVQAHPSPRFRLANCIYPPSLRTGIDGLAKVSIFAFRKGCDTFPPG